MERALSVNWLKRALLWAPFERSDKLTKLILRCFFALIRCAILTAVAVQTISFIPDFSLKDPIFYIPMWVFMVIFEDLSRYSVIRYSINPYKAATIYLMMFLIIETIGYIPGVGDTLFTMRYFITRLPSIMLHIAVSYGMAYFTNRSPSRAKFFAVVATGLHLIMNVLAWGWSQ